MKLKTARKISQAVFFSVFVVLFILTVYPYPEKIRVEILLQSDPLAAAVTMISGRVFVPAMVLCGGLVLALTLLLGRFFCGWVCPLGSLLDGFDFIFLKNNRVREDPEPKPGRRVKYFILAGVLAASLAGADLLHFFSPMSIAPRFFAVVLFPPLVWFGNFLLDLARPLMAAAGWDAMAQVSLKRFFFSGAAGIFLFTLALLLAGIWRRRFFCRYVCPTGAFLSLFSRFGLFKRRVEGACNECERCSAVCRMRAIGEDPRITILGECTLCGDCSAVCARHGNRIGFLPGRGGNDASLDAGRRRLVYSAASGLALAAVVKADLQSAKNLQGNFIRPPGSVPEPDFLARCIRCGLCLKTCKTNGLQPCAFEAGVDGLWTPRLVPRIGGCEDKCNMCGYVCPTSAIRPLPMEEKKYVKMGTAVIDRTRCIAWEQNRLCLICDEICPTDAIDMRVAETGGGPFKVPFINEDRCIGCGLCENRCPIAGRSAVEVFSIGEERKARGSYVTPEKVKLRESKDGQQPSLNKDGEESLPGGFITE